MAPCGSCASDKRELQATQSLKMILAVTWTLKASILAFSFLVWMCSLYFLLIHFNELASFGIISTKCLITKRIKRWREERKALTGRESWGVGWAMRNVCRGWRANGAAVAADRSLLHQLLAGGGSYQAGSSIFTDCLKKKCNKMVAQDLGLCCYEMKRMGTEEKDERKIWEKLFHWRLPAKGLRGGRDRLQAASASVPTCDGPGGRVRAQHARSWASTCPPRGCLNCSLPWNAHMRLDFTTARTLAGAKLALSY